jgi:hypothetical protein
MTGRDSWCGIVVAHRASINNCKNLAMSRLHEWHHPLIVRLKFLVAKHPRPRRFEGGKVGHRQFQDERVVASSEIREKTRRALWCKPLLNCEAFLHHSKSLTSLPELQVEHVADNDHEEPLFCSGRGAGDVSRSWVGREFTPQPRLRDDPRRPPALDLDELDHSPRRLQLMPGGVVDDSPAQLYVGTVPVTRTVRL